MCLEGSDFVSRPRCHNYSLSQINPRTGNVSCHKCGKSRYYTSQVPHWSLTWRKVQQQDWRGNSGNIETNGPWSSRHLEKEGFLLACGETSKTSCLQNSMYKLLNLWVRICLQIKFHPFTTDYYLTRGRWCNPSRVEHMERVPPNSSTEICFQMNT